MNNFEFGEELKKRTKKFAIKVISFTKKLTKSSENIVFINQIIRAASAVASNYRAACRGRSKAEFYSKLSIVIEETDETQFWLEMIEEFNPGLKNEITEIYKEGEDLMKIFAKSRKTMNLSKYSQTHKLTNSQTHKLINS